MKLGRLLATAGLGLIHAAAALEAAQSKTAGSFVVPAGPQPEPAEVQEPEPPPCWSCPVTTPSAGTSARGASMTMPTVQQLATEARAVNAANGWGTAFRFADIPNYLALIHSEVTEAVTADTTS